MIFVWGVMEDDPTKGVVDALTRLGAQIFFFEQDTGPESYMELSTVDNMMEGVLTSPARKIDLSEITAAFFRPYDTRKLLSAMGFSPASKEWTRTVLIEELLATWSETTNALVVNRLSKMASNGSKPYQSSMIRKFGFVTPDTLITTDPEAVLEFMKCHKRIIYKSISGIRSIVSSFSDEHLARLGHVSTCPTQFQEYVPGIDYRVHVVGSEIFACRILSTADDYRYSSSQGSELRIEPCELPVEIADRCVVVTKGLGLAVSGLDLRVAEDGTWYCFEVNPSPGFTFYEETTKQPIGESIARLLINGSN